MSEGIQKARDDLSKYETDKKFTSVQNLGIWAKVHVDTLRTLLDRAIQQQGAVREALEAAKSQLTQESMACETATETRNYLERHVIPIDKALAQLQASPDVVENPLFKKVPDNERPSWAPKGHDVYATDWTEATNICNRQSDCLCAACHMNRKSP